MPRRFNSDYEEIVSLRDGTRARLRLVRPTDKQLLREGFENTSAEARYFRFFVPKTTLSDEEVRYLTEVDNENHVAIGAIATDGGDRERGLGIGRFVRLDDEPAVAEAAFMVVDEVQGKGLGTLLFRRIMAAARERGIAKFRCYVLAENRSMAELMQFIAPDAETRTEEGVATFEFALPDNVA